MFRNKKRNIVHIIYITSSIVFAKILGLGMAEGFWLFLPVAVALLCTEMLSRDDI